MGRTQRDASSGSAPIELMKMGVHGFSWDFQLQNLFRICIQNVRNVGYPKEMLECWTPIIVDECVDTHYLASAAMKLGVQIFPRFSGWIKNSD
jgi:hypothetical protein